MSKQFLLLSKSYFLAREKEAMLRKNENDTAISFSQLQNQYRELASNAVKKSSSRFEIKNLQRLSMLELKALYKENFDCFENELTSDKNYLHNMLGKYQSSFEVVKTNETNKAKSLAEDITAQFQNLQKNTPTKTGVELSSAMKGISDKLTSALEASANSKLNIFQTEYNLQYVTSMKKSFQRLNAVSLNLNQQIANEYKKVLGVVLNKVKNGKENTRCMSHYLARLQDPNEADVFFFHKILEENIANQENYEVINKLIQEYGYVDKAQALKLCGELKIPKYNFTKTFLHNCMKESKHSIFEESVMFTTNIYTNVAFLNNFKNLIENYKLEELNKQINEYEEYEISKNNQEKLNAIKLFIAIHLANQKIFENFLNPL